MPCEQFDRASNALEEVRQVAFIESVSTIGEMLQKRPADQRLKVFGPHSLKQRKRADDVGWQLLLPDATCNPFLGTDMTKSKRMNCDHQ